MNAFVDAVFVVFYRRMGGKGILVEQASQATLGVKI